MNSETTPETTPVDPAAALVPAKKSKVRRNLILAGSAAGIVGIGSTLAANINLNSGENVEFGQGVARTTACDEDGFTINPVTSYDNSLSIFRLDYVEVSGLNLTPVGTGWDDPDLNGLYADTTTAQAARPGEYYDTDANQWKRTCDGIVLDFKAYTDDTAYWTATRDGYSNGTTDSISTPVGWAQAEGNLPRGTRDVSNFGFAIVFDIEDDNNSQTWNYGVGTDSLPDTYSQFGSAIWENLDHSTPANSYFTFRSDPYWRPDAASISKITVSSMKYLPSGYDLYSSSGVGVND